MAWKTRAEHLESKYSITEAQYEEILRTQQGVCAICRNHQRYKRLAVDHDHKTGQVRGLLCEQCNRGLGRFFDSPFRLRRAAEYIDKANTVWRKVMEVQKCQPQAQSVK